VTLTSEGDNNLILHYIPYAFWQVAALLMAIQQCWFIVLRDSIPFEWATPALLWKYLLSIIFLVFAYHILVISFILKVPIVNPEEGFVYAVIIIPAFFTYYKSQDSNDTRIVFIDEYVAD